MRAKVPLVVAAGGSRMTLLPGARQRSAGGRVTVTAQLAGARRGARVTAKVRGAKGRVVVLRLRRSRGAWRVTTRKRVSGTAAGVLVTARSGGRTRIAAAVAR